MTGDSAGEAAKRGYELFTSERLACSQCHSGFNFSDHVHYEGQSTITLPYHNTGLYNLDERGAYPEPNTGVYNVTEDPAHVLWSRGRTEHAGVRFGVTALTVERSITGCGSAGNAALNSVT